MRYKPVPQPCDIQRLREVYAAVPDAPGETEDCCEHLCAHGPLGSPTAAREWLPFLRALGLASRNARGYSREEWKPESTLGESFRTNVLGVAELLSAVEKTGPVTLTELSRRDDIPISVSHNTVEARLRRLVGWSVTFGLLVESAGEYTRR